MVSFGVFIFFFLQALNKGLCVSTLSYTSRIVAFLLNIRNQNMIKAMEVIY